MKIKTVQATATGIGQLLAKTSVVSSAQPSERPELLLSNQESRYQILGCRPGA
jgi:hypothetical protein